MSERAVRDLRAGLSGLETTTMAALSILAVGSGYWTYMGVRGLLDSDGPLALGGALIYSIAVSMAIFCFWSYLLKFFPLVRSAAARFGLTVALAIGAAAIIAMSSWLNAAALAGSAAIERHLATAVEQYQQRLERAHENALAAQSLLPDIQIASRRFAQMSQEEAQTGSLTGTAGRGTVAALLSQTASQLEELEGQIIASREVVDTLYTDGTQRLTEMRRLVSASGDVAQRSVAFAEQAVALVGVISSLRETSVAPAVRRTADDFARSFVRPAAAGGSTDLGDRQEAVIDSVTQAVAQTSAVLVAAADEILAREHIDPFRFEPINSAQAVLLYGEEFIPSWAGAIAIDMMPAVLVLILMVVHAAIRRAEARTDVLDSLTLAELTAASAALQRLDRGDGAAPMGATAAAGRVDGMGNGGEPGRTPPPAASAPGNGQPPVGWLRPTRQAEAEAQATEPWGHEGQGGHERQGGDPLKPRQAWPPADGNGDDPPAGRDPAGGPSAGRPPLSSG